MVKNLFILLLLYYSVKTEYDYEIIEEFIPKTIISGSLDKIFKYHLSCNNGRNKTSINFQSMIMNYAYIQILPKFQKMIRDGIQIAAYIGYLMIFLLSLLII
mgnify:CR=1 FL=1